MEALHAPWRIQYILGPKPTASETSLFTRIAHSDDDFCTAIGPAGNSGKLEYYDGASRKTFDIARGLSVEAGSPNRVRGRLKTSIEEIAFDLSFDLGSVASCQADAYRCGPDDVP